MLTLKESSSRNDLSGGEITQLKETDMISDQNQVNPVKRSEKGSLKPGISQELNLSYLSHNSKLGLADDGKSDDNLDENRCVERDFLQLSGNSSKREIEDDNDVCVVRDKKPKLETLDLSLALSDESSNDFSAASLSLSLSCSVSVSHNPSCSITRNSTENYEIWNGGEGTNGSVHSRFRPVGDGGNRSNSGFPSELVPRKTCSSSFSSTPERILQGIVSESIPIMAQVIQELTDETIQSTKDYLKKLITIPERNDELVRLQLRLERRSDLTKETLSKANKNQLEILVFIRTSLETFLSVEKRLPISELIEIFCYDKCKNPNCKRVLPVDDCECKICSKTKGFCSECTCPVCLNFDSAHNTCSWVGCDVCSHWCHVDCGVQNNLIKPGPSLHGPKGTTEIQFHCIGCGHASEMFGFIKDAFKSCAQQWSYDTLKKELDRVKKIFRLSSDFKGKELHSKASEMILKLDKKTMSTSDVCTFIIQFFNYTDGISEFPPLKVESLQNVVKPQSNMKIEDEWSVKSTKKDGFDFDFDSVESGVRIKEAEARMFQKKADEARKEAEGYKRMIRVHIEKLDEEYSAKISKLRLNESEERKKQKIEEFKVLENAHCEYYKMKMRMQTEIAGLLQRMEYTKKQWV